MGSALASNLLGAGFGLVAYDAAGPGREPDGAVAAGDVAEVARLADVVVFSLPDGRASEQVARQIVDAPDRRATHVVDTSTIGVDAAASVSGVLGAIGVSYLDAPVSGGVAGARARTLVVMFAGDDQACAHVEPVLAGLSDRRHRVGGRPGMAQALKLANNFLSATALAATSEAVSFGLSVGLDMATMLQVLDAGSGQSSATSDKFPKHVLTGRYAAGFANSLMDKDLRLYLGEVEGRGGPAVVGRTTVALWDQFSAAEPGADFTGIFRFIDRGRGRPTAEDAGS